jgi:peroxiredoxin/tetratricopeptide (TPR) repeat protein
MQKSIASAVFAVSLAAVVAMTATSAQGPLDGNTPADRHKAGHSKLGEAFDEGPRERPSKMEGIGRSHFPITTSNPEVQQWFDQGHTLIHSFWFFEAERAFRWAVKLDPEAPMPYWGLARATSGQRAAAFMKEASKRKAKGTQRERDYIEAWELMYGVPGVPSDRNKFLRAVERLIIKYPDDVEAKALYAEATMGGNRVGTEAVIKQILAADKDHPGGHHYRIHNWDDEDGAQALESCRRYGDIASGIGHALHMPGHIYAGLGMYHEATISLDAATRAEIAYMGRQMVFPYNTWNYAHNRNYLSYVQEQLGLPSEAIRGARELLAVPLDPKLNDATRFSPHWQGLSALTRTLVKFERWNEILAPNSIPWGTSLRDKLLRSYAEALAKLATDSPEAATAVAEHEALKREIDKPENSSYRTQFEVQSLELRATEAFAKGNAIDGLMLLTQAAPKELELRASYDDPPFYPTVMYAKLGHAYLKQSSPKLAVEAFEKALKAVRNDPFALAGLARARHAAGDTAGATEALGQLLHVWQDAEPGLRWLQEAKAAGIKATPTDRSPGPQRSYRTIGLDKYGPAIWKPFAAPSLTTRDHTGAPVSLDQFRGKNVVLVFYLGVGCAHCVQQLKDLNERAGRFKAVDAEVIAVSADTPESNAKSQGQFTLRLLSDDTFVNARRFKSYDDFEEMALHSTILIDKEGRVHWARHGAGPFTDYDFLLKQLQRMNGGKDVDSTTNPNSQDSQIIRR